MHPYLAIQIKTANEPHQSTHCCPSGLRFAFRHAKLRCRQARQTTSDSIDFTKQVLPVLEKHCWSAAAKETRVLGAIGQPSGIDLGRELWRGCHPR